MSINLTLRLDEKTIDRIRHIAVDRGTSVSAWVGDLVTRTAEELDGFEPARKRALKAMNKPVPVSDARVHSPANRLMSAEVFVDTNILYYANTDSSDLRHALARKKVEALWEEPGRAAVSVQVLQELHVNLVRKAGLSPRQSAQRVSHYLAWRVVDNDRALLAAAFEVQTRWQLSIWDSLIVAAAQRSHAATLWSEELAHGQHYGAVMAANPLLQDAAAD